ncbi:hypothetical protein EVAR_20452_1 [Eumeta japonica]|uniref:Uncharacterized protein n=1 Tax=Eumeta variegata TaxID=151549 RepID=A0A4C1TY42_EUMVA|nr:hypothetical protein EVAR_20452_1 [Eumeta japonica]
MLPYLKFDPSYGPGAAAPTLTIRPSHLRESADQRLPGQQVLYNDMPRASVLCATNPPRSQRHTDAHRTVTSNKIRNENGTKIESKERLGAKLTRVENECGFGIRIKSVNGIGIKNETGLRLTLFHMKDGKINSMPMLAELQALIIWASHTQEGQDVCRAS